MNMLMNDLISLIISIVSCLIIYKLFENHGFKVGFIFRLIVQFVVYLINGNLIEFYNLGLTTFVILIIIIVVIILMTTCVDYFAYKKTKSLFSYFILGALLESLVMAVTTPIFEFIIQKIMI